MIQDALKNDSAGPSIRRDEQLHAVSILKFSLDQKKKIVWLKGI